MKSEWQQFLVSTGAEFSGDPVNNSVISYGNPEQERQAIDKETIICDLSHYGLISAAGEDTVTFLQGQLTNDVSLVDPTHCQLSSYCNPKGRMLANFRIFNRNDTLYLTMPAELVATIGSRIGMYIMRSKVNLHDASDTLIGIGVHGNKAQDLLSAIAGKLPDAVDTVTHQDDYTLLRIAGPEARYEIYGTLEAMKTLWQELKPGTKQVGADAWELLNIRAGIPTVVAATSEAFIPQMTNMELVNGVSFKKGCYTGQEIVARMHYLGKLKKRMYRIKVNCEKQPMPGDHLFAEQSKGGSNTGSIVNAQLNANGHYEALAVIQITDAENEKIRLYDANGPEIEILDLPYSLNQ